MASPRPVGLAIEKALSPKYKVYTAAAGSFYRRVTLLALEIKGEFGGGDTSWLEENLRTALQNDQAYDEQLDWEGVHSQAVDELVSVAGQFDFMQAAARDWWYKTADIVRYARDHTEGEPTPEQISAARDKIAERRQLDRTRKATPYLEPENQLLFDPLTADAQKAVIESFETATGEAPRVIRYDTTSSPMEVTLRQTGALAASAIGYLNSH
jgi:hypothetical protein